MVIEHVILPVTLADRSAFLAAFGEARPLIEASPGFLGLTLHIPVEGSDGLLLIVQWESVAAHRDGFRRSIRYQAWRELLHRFYPVVPTVSYYEAVS